MGNAIGCEDKESDENFDRKNINMNANRFSIFEKMEDKEKMKDHFKYQSEF